jgi:hypothetical protein
MTTRLRPDGSGVPLHVQPAAGPPAPPALLTRLRPDGSALPLQRAAVEIAGAPGETQGTAAGNATATAITAPRVGVVGGASGIGTATGITVRRVGVTGNAAGIGAANGQSGSGIPPLVPIWPESLPAVPLIEGYEEHFEYRGIDFQPDTGPRRVRARETVGCRVYVAPYMLTTAAVATLQTFYRQTTRAGEIRFDWVHPRTRAVIQARFTGPPKITEAPRPDLRRVIIELDHILSPSPPGTGSFVWPASLPTKPLVDAYDETFAQLAIHSDMHGIPLARRRTTADAREINASIRVSLAQAVTFDGFYETDLRGAVLAFSWTHPAEGVVNTAFREAPRLTALTPRLMEISLPLEVLP